MCIGAHQSKCVMQNLTTGPVRWEGNRDWIRWRAKDGGAIYIRLDCLHQCLVRTRFAVIGLSVICRSLLFFVSLSTPGHPPQTTSSPLRAFIHPCPSDTLVLILPVSMSTEGTNAIIPKHIGTFVVLTMVMERASVDASVQNQGDSKRVDICWVWRPQHMIHSIFILKPFSDPRSLWVTAAIRMEMFHHRTKVISQNSVYCICSDPSL